MAYDKKRAFRDNIDCIKAAFSPETANTSDNNALLKYRGFGPLKCIQNPAEKDEDIARWKSDKALFPLARELNDFLRSVSKDDAEYRTYINSLRSGTLTAFYTPQTLIQAVADNIKDFEPGNFLDPSAGTGIFGRVFRQRFPEMSVMNYEIDPLTGLVLKKLIPDADNRITGFETIGSTHNGSFDFIASNIPFGDIKVYDRTFIKDANAVRAESLKNIHDYYFVKGLELLREGGIMIYITSQAIMDNPEKETFRRYLMDRSQLVSAIRLPGNTFEGTSVGSDLIILQKNGKKELLSEREQKFIGSTKISSGIYINNLHSEPSRMVHTHSEIKRAMYAHMQMKLQHERGIDGISNDLSIMLAEDWKLWFTPVLFSLNKTEAIPQKPQIIKSAEKTITEIPLLVSKENQVVEPVIGELFPSAPIARSFVKPKQSISKRKRSPYRNQPQTAGMMDLFTQQIPEAEAATTQTTFVNVVQKRTITAPVPYEGEMKYFYREGTLVR